MFIAHIGAMDTFARGLRNAARMQDEGVLSGMLDKRYSSWGSGLGPKVRAGQCTLGEMHDLAVKLGEPEQRSGKQEKYEVVWNDYL